MPAQETPAIIITVRDYGEADRLVTFLTPARGRLTGIAKHARKSKKRFANCLEPLSRVILFLSDRARGDLEFLEKGEAVRSFMALRRDLTRLGAGALVAELAAEMASPPEATASIFAALETALTLLDDGMPPDSLLPVFLLRLLTLGGYGLGLHHCRGCGAEPDAPLVVNLPRGGVLCSTCRRGAPAPRFPLTPAPGSCCAWPRTCLWRSWAPAFPAGAARPIPGPAAPVYPPPPRPGPQGLGLLGQGGLPAQVTARLLL